MLRDRRRITLITRPPARHPDRPWNVAPGAASRVIVVGSFTVLRYALEQSLSGMAQDVERLIIDRTATAAQYLELLASRPTEFPGDVLSLRHACSRNSHPRKALRSNGTPRKGCQNELPMFRELTRSSPHD